MTLTPIVPGALPSVLLPAGGETPTAVPVARPRRKGRADRAKQDATPDNLVSCVFCREGIPTSSFTTVVSDPRLMSASCPNCALQVSATSAMWARWNRPSSEGPERGRAEMLRARRVAVAARLLREHLAVTLPREA
jgi:hypothetical protein